MGRKKAVNLGEQRFDRLIQENKFYIDKTGFIGEWYETSAAVTLITRPRRFGKTLNMSMMECFFSNKYADRGDLFEGLSVWEEKDGDGSYKFRELQGRFPVIFLSFASVEAPNYTGMLYKISEEIVQLYAQNRFLLEEGFLDENEQEYYRDIKPGMDAEKTAGAVKMMAGFLYRRYGREVIVLLDEYDTPMQTAWIYDYWDEAALFFSGLFSSIFKNNPYLYRGLITGITRIAKESIFSSLNHPKVVTTTSNQYALSFGFTEEEVFKALEEAGLDGEKAEVKKWYDGFTFGRHEDIYNPWSIASFIDNDGEFDSYWTNTSSNSLVNFLVQKGNPEIKTMMEALLQRKEIRTRLDEQIVFNQLEGDAGAVWSLLLATGYLKVIKVEHVGERREKVYTLALTNMEVEGMFDKMVRGWFGGETKVYYNEFIRALLSDNVRKMNTFMNKVALNTFSSFDSGNKPSGQGAPERFYHGFVLGLVVDLADTHKVRSNRESGYGRYDVMIEPLDRRGKAFIFEFKVLDSDEDEVTLEDTLAHAHAQIEEKRYGAELAAEGFAPEQIRKYGFAFQGKKCLIG